MSKCAGKKNILYVFFSTTYESRTPFHTPFTPSFSPLPRTNLSHWTKPNQCTPTHYNIMPEDYQKVSAREHVLLRPDTYVGSTEEVEWTNTNLATHHKVVPALYKIFDEVLVNAGDNITTGKTTSIEVNITDQGFTVENDGTCVPVVKHKEEKI